MPASDRGVLEYQEGRRHRLWIMAYDPNATHETCGERQGLATRETLSAVSGGALCLVRTKETWAVRWLIDECERAA